MTKKLGKAWREKLAKTETADDLNAYIRPSNDKAEKEASAFLKECRHDMPNLIEAALERKDDHVCIQIKPFWVSTPSYKAFVDWLGEQSIEISSMGVEQPSGELVMTICPANHSACKQQPLADGYAGN
jgi:hypothetical protein